ncbi:transcription termination factor Rho [Nesterenkonia aerolata]|uniref:Transcription termination factor Rho n=1 Tax=Nesterenkonia aerolata TaxID=3074079 RepID=A0ABU2DSM9_9MICC|nr:transcription termination factor Rho [Nesterenkonia sp. LY-0111]MDR8019509.1 transcription termination factor Rho [Nesterenkonia sp. LY-0111]
MTDTTTETAPAQGNTQSSAEQSPGLAGLKLAQLQALASQLGITGGSRMRKSALVEAISAHQRGGAVAEREERARRKSAEQAQEAQEAGAEEQSAEKTQQQKSPAESTDEAQGEQKSGGRGRGRSRSRSASGAESSNENNQAGKDKSGKGQSDKDAAAQADQSSDEKTQQDKSQHDKSQQDKGQNDKGQGGKNQDRRNDRGDKSEKNGDRGGRQRGEKPEKNDRHDQGGRGGDNRNDNRNDSREDTRGQDNRGENRGDRNDNRGDNRDSRGDNRGKGGGNKGGQDDSRNRRSRNRNDRNNRRRGRGGPDVDDTEITEDDVLLPVAGILDVLDNYAFLRTSGYLSGPNDVYVSLAQVKRYNLRKGDAVHGHIRAPREGENQNKKQKFSALVKLDAVNGRPAEQNAERVDFGKLVPLYPQERLRLEGDPKNIGPRVIDLVAPIGKGQRGLIVSPPKAGKTIILQSLAQAIKANNPEVHLMMVLVDERPEEVTDMQRTVDGEVIASTFDRPADDHTTVAELAIERAKRLVELGKDVVVLLDSMTRLGRAYNQAAPASGRILSGGVDASALYPPKRFFGAARNIENGGSLTILATALVETGSKMDEVIFEEFKGTGNMELRLSRQLADRRIFPAVDVNASSTRREENLLSAEEIRIMWKLRRVLSGLEAQQGLELLINKLKDTGSNAEFLLLANKTTLGDGKN